MKTIRLVEGRAWVELRPLFGTLASVVGGTVHWPGDILERPAGVTWEEAARIQPGGDTALSPFELETIYDSVTDWMFRRESDSGLLDLLRAVEVQSTEPEDDGARSFAALLEEADLAAERRRSEAA